MEEFTRIKDLYHFECTRCGNCCSGDQKVFLNLYDLYKLARYHQFDNTRKLFDAGIVLLVEDQNNAFLPRLRFRIKPFPFCPYLMHEPVENNKIQTYCLLHPDFKPLVCSMAPVGRIVDFEKNEDHFVFVKPAPDCPGIKSKKENSLGDIISEYQQALRYQLAFFQLLQKAREQDFKREAYLDLIYSMQTTLSFDEVLNLLK